MQLGITRVVLVGASGDSTPLASLTVPPDDANAVVAAIPSALVAGRWTVVWRTASRDGHPARGRFTFTVAADTAAASPVASAADTAATTSAARAAPESVSAPSAAPIDTAGAGQFGVGSAAYVAIRWVFYVLFLGLIGVIAFVQFVVPRMLALQPARGTLAIDAVARARRMGLGLAIGLAAVELARLGAQSLALNGAGTAWTAAGVHAVLGGTLWGSAWILQVLALAAVIAALARARAERLLMWHLAALAVLVLAVGAALSGHAAAVPGATWIAVVSDALHLLAGGGWLGTLLVVSVAAIPAALDTARGDRARATADVIGAFSPFALACGALILITGIIAAWLHLGTLDALWSSDYGRVLLIKLATLVVVAALGAVNWRVQRPRLADGAGERAVRRSAAAELVMGAVLLAVTAVLVATPPPAQESAAAAPVATPGAR